MTDDALTVMTCGRREMNDPYHSETYRSYRLEDPLRFAAIVAVVASIIILISLAVMLWKRRKK